MSERGRGGGRGTSGSDTADAADSTDSADASAPRSGDPVWQTDRVDPSFDVDGAADRAHLLSPATRFAIARSLYAVLGATYLALARSDRGLYPLVRTVGRLVGRREGAEQRIAENEYVLAALDGTSRPPIGSRPWFIGGALLGGFVLAAVGALGRLVALAVVGVGPQAFAPAVGRIVLGLLGAGMATIAISFLLLERVPPGRDHLDG